MEIVYCEIEWIEMMQADQESLRYENHVHWKRFA